MSDSSVLLKSYSVEDFLSPENLRCADATVVEIFSMMFGLEIKAADAPDCHAPASDSDQRTAVVGFSGVMRGSCQIRMSSLAVGTVASAMLGGVPVDDDESLDDALGELCNMLAGGWKNGIPALNSEVSLSPPTVISGRDYKIRVHKPSERLSRDYRFGGHCLHLTLCRENSAPATL